MTLNSTVQHTNSPDGDSCSPEGKSRVRPGVPDVWLQQYFLPSEDHEQAGNTVKHKYRPPSSDLQGILTACGVIAAWSVTFLHALFQVHLPGLDGSAPVDYKGRTVQPSTIQHVLAVFFLLEFLYTGLFITTHDAMHGTIALRNRRLNDFLGQLAISLYAWFDYSMLHRKHWEHHNHTGKVGVDPDFHRGNPHMLLWFISFMLEYMSIWQFVRIAWWATLFQLLGVPMTNILMFMTGSAVTSAARLFYFGTYVPHHPDPGPDAGTKEMGWAVSRTSTAPAIVEFVKCWCFGLHWEHHRWPYAPWWHLPLCRELSGRNKAMQ